MNISPSLRRMRVLLLTMACFAGGVMADDVPLWWKQTLRVERNERGLNLYLVRDGALVVDQLEIILPHERFAFAWKKHKQGVIGKDGRIVLPIEYDQIDEHDEAGVFLVKKDERWGLVAYDGSIRLPISYDAIIDRGEPGVPWVVWQGAHRGLVDPASGRLLLAVEYSAVDVQPPYVLVSKESGDSGHTDTTWFALDLAGQPIPGVVPADGLSVWKSAGLLVVGQKQVVDSLGNLIIPAATFDSIRPAGEAAMVCKDERCGLIDQAGVPLTPMRYTQMWLQDEHGEGLIGVKELEPASGKLLVGFLDGTGKVIVEPRWDRVESHIAQRDGVEIPFFVVSRDDKTGSLDADGETRFPPRFDDVHRMDYGDPVYWVRQDGLFGLCDLSRAECPVPVVYNDFQSSDLSDDDDLYIAALNGKYGVVSDKNEIVVPFEYERIKPLPRVFLKPTEVEASKQFVVTRFRLEQDDDRHWKATILPGSPIGEQDYDQHPLALKSKPVLDARYLPEGIISDANVLAAAQAGRLREAVFPSIQISGHTAFVNFNQFVREGQSELAESMTFCRQADGFRLLTTLSVDENIADACDETSLDGLQFHPADEGVMVCDGCQALGLPERWLRKDPLSHNECSLASLRVADWTLVSAREAYADWRMRWKAEFPTLLAMQEGTEGSAPVEADNRDESVYPNSRAFSTLATMLFDPQRLAWLIDDPASKVDWHGLIRRFSELLETAEPMGVGGIYPETNPRFAGTCPEVWYMKLPILDAALATGSSIPGLDDYVLPAMGEFKRNVYPFLTFKRTPQGLKLVGISRELLQTLLWHEVNRCFSVDAENISGTTNINAPECPEVRQ